MSENITEVITPEHAQFLENYEAFSPAVDTLLQEFVVDGVDKRKEHPAFLGSGTVSDVFLIRGEDRDYVARIPRSYEETTADLTGLTPNHEVIHDVLTTALRSKGIPHLEQIRAASYEKGVVISELMPGRTMTSLTEEDRESITNEQLLTLAKTFRLAKAAGVVPELENPDNLLYDPVEGFGLIDLDSEDNSKFRRFGFVALGLKFDIDCATLAISSSVNDVGQRRLLAWRIHDAFYADDTK